MDKSNLTPEELIESQLGRDHLPNLHWQPVIPNTWDIPARHNSTFQSPTTKQININGIDYQLNNLGYRANFDFTDALKSEEVVLLLGDSDTFGRGQPLQEIYSTKMQRQTSYCIVNLGVSGISPDGMTRVGVQSMLALGNAVKHVCVLWPVFSLREFVSKNFACGVHNTSDYVPYADWWDHIDWVGNNYNYRKNKILLESVAQSIGAKYHDLIINRYDKDSPTQYVQDGQYTELNGVSHTAVANYFLKLISNKPTLYQTLKS